MTTSSKLPLSVPVIDFSSRDLKPETAEWDSVRGQVRKALEEYGCFEALLDGASVAELRKATFKASEKIFDLPLEVKLGTKSSDKRYEGYFTIPAMPLYEGMGYSVDEPEVLTELTQKLWPQGNVTDVSNTIQSFAEKLVELSVKVRRMTMESFGLEKYVEEHLNSAENHFHLFKYKGIEENMEKVGFEPHIDRQFLTILCQNDVVDGLDIKTKDGQEWIKAKASKDSSFLVIAGASLHVQLNGGVFPPFHRVVITENKDRYVAGLFMPPKKGLIIHAPDEIIDDEHPRLFKPFDFEDYLEFTKTNIKGRDLSNLKVYCSL